MRLIVATLLSASLAACGVTSGGLAPGQATLPQVIEQMGEPSMVWSEPDGSLQLEFVRAPGGNGNFMAWVGRDGRLRRLEQVLTTENAGRLEVGMSREQVRRVLGRPAWTESLDGGGALWHWRLVESLPPRQQIDVRFGADGNLLAVAHVPVSWPPAKLARARG